MAATAEPRQVIVDRVINYGTSRRRTGNITLLNEHGGCECPTCGQHANGLGLVLDLDMGVVAGPLGQAKIGPRQAAVLHCLIKSYPGWTSKDRMLEFVYQGDEPECGEKTINVMMHKLRYTLPLVGYRIDTSYGNGWRLAEVGAQKAKPFQSELASWRHRLGFTVKESCAELGLSLAGYYRYRLSMPKWLRERCAAIERGG